MGELVNILWNLAITILQNITTVWEWLFQEIKVNIPIKIPIFLPDGINFNFGYSPIELLGSGIILLLALWIIKELVPTG